MYSNTNEIVQIEHKILQRQIQMQMQIQTQTPLFILPTHVFLCSILFFDFFLEYLGHAGCPQSFIRC